MLFLQWLLKVDVAMMSVRGQCLWLLVVFHWPARILVCLARLSRSPFYMGTRVLRTYNVESESHQQKDHFHLRTAQLLLQRRAHPLLSTGTSTLT
jgi:hypothetical protein